MTIRIYTLADKLLWQETVSSTIFHDFYHTWTYHSMDKRGTPKLFVYSEGKDFIAFPFLIRTIQGTDYLDITSVYGYAGPVSNIKFEEMSDELKDNFKKAFIKLLISEKYISVFCRLHPFTNQEILLERFGGLYAHGRTVVIDLQTSMEEQRSKYRKTTRENINQLRSKGYYVAEATDDKSIRAFIAIYSENMRRIGASEDYLFDDDYFFTLLRSDEIHSRLLLVYYEGAPVCGTLVTYTNKIIQGHLISTKTDHLKMSPAKLLVEEVSILGRKDVMQHYHLGGGVGGNEDSLFAWKAGFSDIFLNFQTWRFISDEKIYMDLSNDGHPVPDTQKDFFPRYRIGAPL